MNRKYLPTGYFLDEGIGGNSLTTKSCIMSLTTIDHYMVQYSSNAFPPRIGLQSSGNLFGQLVFMPDGSVLPPDAITSGQIQLYYHLSDFTNILAILQKEKSVYLLYNGSGSGFENGVQTTEAAGK
jgi:hypothetical protein